MVLYCRPPEVLWSDLDLHLVLCRLLLSEDDLCRNMDSLLPSGVDNTVPLEFVQGEAPMEAGVKMSTEEVLRHYKKTPEIVRCLTCWNLKSEQEYAYNMESLSHLHWTR